MTATTHTHDGVDYCWCDAGVPYTDLADQFECLDDRGDNTCSDEVAYKDALSGTGRRFPRCDRHWDDRLVEQERINQTYGYPGQVNPPSWFDPLDAGEEW